MYLQTSAKSAIQMLMSVARDADGRPRHGGADGQWGNSGPNDLIADFRGCWPILLIREHPTVASALRSCRPSTIFTRNERAKIQRGRSRGHFRAGRGRAAARVARIVILGRRHDARPATGDWARRGHSRRVDRAGGAIDRSGGTVSLAHRPRSASPARYISIASFPTMSGSASSSTFARRSTRAATSGARARCVSGPTGTCKRYSSRRRLDIAFGSARSRVTRSA